MKVSSLFFILIIAGKLLAYHQIFGDIPKAPALIIYKLTDSAQGVYRTIDNWGDATGTENISTVDGSEGITLPADANEAAIVLDLKPSNYSAILTSTETTEKEALVEAYEVVK